MTRTIPMSRGKNFFLRIVSPLFPLRGWMLVSIMIVDSFHLTVFLASSQMIHSVCFPRSEHRWGGAADSAVRKYRWHVSDCSGSPRPRLLPAKREHTVCQIAVIIWNLFTYSSHISPTSWQGSFQLQTDNLQRKVCAEPCLMRCRPPCPVSYHKQGLSSD